MANHRRGAFVSWVALATFGVAGCAADAPLKSTLDDKGRTWLSADTLVTLARAVPRFSNSARDYLYLAPVETNSMGARRDYLWVGLGSTVDRAWQSAAPNAATTVVLVLDGLAISLPLTAWDAAFTPSLYATAVPVYQVQRAAISLDQLDRLARATVVEVQVVAADGSTASYELWKGAWHDWQLFIARTDAVPDSNRRTARAAGE